MESDDDRLRRHPPPEPFTNLMDGMDMEGTPAP
ncbi:MAG: hypothetical protein AVDCRST_MAG21-142 [uncultured Nocardioidaceae bacterium]|uniref:Uncharacterized protein n=2 Tax=Actinomycetota TaxID=201174 RepID=A0A6J4R7M4_9ACTN|nr:MAG: hypothetical protein AVDCRST_MAG21-142 [uncultured Nocardioidaceae bacterium]CAA9466388.1 MAG: hypothetical protein AVDCRST_MAG05-95 [uncultured Rubrobacteraceae bacterium]